MSNIQGQPHPQGATEHLDYAEAHVDGQGLVTTIVVVTRHYLETISIDRQVTIYTINPGPGERDLAAVLTATRRTNLQAALTALTAAVAQADTPTDPAPPLPNSN